MIAEVIEAAKPPPLTPRQNNALRYIARATTQFYIRRAVGKQTLDSLLRRQLIEDANPKGVPSYRVTDAGRAIIAADGPLA